MTTLDLNRVPIRDNGEPLVDLRAACPGILVGEQPLYAREGVATRLNLAQTWLDTHQPGYHLRIGDAYRSPRHQARLFQWACLVARCLHPFQSGKRMRALADQYVAAPDAVTPAPHTTGGAVDVGLMTPNGKRAHMGPFTLAATRADYSHVDALARRHRDILYAAMQQAEFVNYPLEWWHWSYGDCLWALQASQPAALYGAVEAPHSQRI